MPPEVSETGPEKYREFSPQFIEEVSARLRNRAENLLGSLLKKPRRYAPGKYKCLCPLPDHEDKDPSFDINLGNGAWFCFGCHQGGNLIQLYMKLKNWSFKEAIYHLAKEVGLDPDNPDMIVERTPRPQPTARQEGKQHRVNYDDISRTLSIHQIMNGLELSGHLEPDSMSKKGEGVFRGPSPFTYGQGGEIIVTTRDPEATDPKGQRVRDLFKDTQTIDMEHGNREGGDVLNFLAALNDPKTLGRPSKEIPQQIYQAAITGQKILDTPDPDQVSQLLDDWCHMGVKINVSNIIFDTRKAIGEVLKQKPQPLPEENLEILRAGWISFADNELHIPEQLQDKISERDRKLIEQAWQWFTQEKNHFEPWVLERFHTGFFWDPNGWRKESNYLHRRIVWPIRGYEIDEQGNLKVIKNAAGKPAAVAMLGRLMPWGSMEEYQRESAKYPKYRMTAGAPVKETMFGLEQFNLEQVGKYGWLIVEGPTDLMKLHQDGFQNGLAALTSRIYNEHMIRFLLNPAINPSGKITIFFDDDAAGRKAQEEGVDIIRRTAAKMDTSSALWLHHNRDYKPKIVVVRSVGDGKDPGERTMQANRAILEQYGILPIGA